MEKIYENFLFQIVGPFCFLELGVLCSLQIARCKVYQKKYKEYFEKSISFFKKVVLFLYKNWAFIFLLYKNKPKPNVV